MRVSTDCDGILSMKIRGMKEISMNTGTTKGITQAEVPRKKKFISVASSHPQVLRSIPYIY